MKTPKAKTRALGVFDVFLIKSGEILKNRKRKFKRVRGIKLHLSNF